MANEGKKVGVSLERYAEDQTRARFTENQEIARMARALRSAVDQKDKEISELQKKLGLYERLDKARLDPPEWLAPKKPAKSHTGIPCLLLTDVHWDETVDPRQVDGVNCYNRTIAEQRLKRLFEGTINVTRDYMAGLRYEGFQLFLGGDIVSGIIHEELRETNEATIMDSVVSVLEPLEAGINLLAQTFGKVHMTAVVGNHGRNSRKPRAKNRAQDNFDWLIYKLIERDFRGRSEVTTQVADGADAHVQVYSTRYLLTHGDQFRGGTGISAALAPLLLGAHRKTRRQSAAGKPYDLMVMGHFHQSIFFPSKGLIVGGSVIGYNEYAALENLEPEPPQNTLWITTPERGVTLSSPVYVSDRAAEGW